MLTIGSVIDGKYKILNKIGQGGMSVVYLAMNEKANKQWAIKEIRKDGVKDFQVVKQSLIVETDLLKKLDHPNLPSIVDIIEDDNTFLIVMDYVEGRSLEKELEEERRMFYVAMTRAKEELHLYFPRERAGKAQKISRFLQEIDRSSAVWELIEDK